MPPLPRSALLAVAVLPLTLRCGAPSPRPGLAAAGATATDADADAALLAAADGDADAAADCRAIASDADQTARVDAGSATPGTAAPCARPSLLCGVTPEPRLSCFDPATGAIVDSIALAVAPTSLAWHAATGRLLATFAEPTDREGTRVAAFAPGPLRLIAASEVLPGAVAVVVTGHAVFALRTDAEGASAALDARLVPGLWTPLDLVPALSAAAWLAWAPAEAVLVAARGAQAATWIGGALPPPPAELGAPLVAVGGAPAAP